MGQKTLWVWIDGEIRRPEDSRVEVLDHGFLYGESIYETLRTHGGRVFRLEAHLDRLFDSAEAIRLDLPFDREGFRGILDSVIEARPEGREAGVRLMVTRGVGPLGLDSRECTSPRVVAIAWPVVPGPHPSREEGISLVISAIRRNPPSALDPRIKSGNFLNNILAYQEAVAAGAFEAVLPSVDGHVTECTTSNIFWVREGMVRSSTSEGILLGVTRAAILEVLEEHRIPHELGAYPVDDLRRADEIFITSTLKGVLPAVELDGARVGDGSPGRVTRRIQDLYEELTRRAE